MDFLDDEHERIEKALVLLAGMPILKEKAEMEIPFCEAFIAMEAERMQIRKLLSATLEEMD